MRLEFSFKLRKNPDPCWTIKACPNSIASELLFCPNFVQCLIGIYKPIWKSGKESLRKPLFIMDDRCYDFSIWFTGSTMVKVAPCPLSPLAFMLPLSRSTIFLQNAKPKPVPSHLSLEFNLLNVLKSFPKIFDQSLSRYIARLFGLLPCHFPGMFLSPLSRSPPAFAIQTWLQLSANDYRRFEHLDDCLKVL